MAVLARTLVFVPLVTGATLAGCGLDPFGESGGGDSELPTSGMGPFARFDADDATPAAEPFVFTDPSAELFDPTVLAGGAGLRVWMSRQAPGADAQIYYGELTTVHDLPAKAPALALAADQAWEEGRVAAPSVVDLGGKHLVMFYQGGTDAPAIGRADSTDDGATWTKAAQPVLAGAQVPSAGYAGGAFALFVTRPGSPAIWRATSPDGGGGGAGAGQTFAFDAAPVLAPRPGLAKAFDADHLDDPSVVVTTEVTGQVRWALYATGYASAPTDAGAGGMPSIGAAGSFDGASWERFGGAAAQLGATATGPAVLQVSSAQWLMLYADENGSGRAIAAAHNP